MGTADGNRLRPEEHTTGGPVVRQAVGHRSADDHAGPTEPYVSGEKSDAPIRTGASWRWRAQQGGMTKPGSEGESASPFGKMSWLAISNPRALCRAGFLAALCGAGLDGDPPAHRGHGPGAAF